MRRPEGSLSIEIDYFAACTYENSSLASKQQRQKRNVCMVASLSSITWWRRSRPLLCYHSYLKLSNQCPPASSQLSPASSLKHVATPVQSTKICIYRMRSYIYTCTCVCVCVCVCRKTFMNIYRTHMLHQDVHEHISHTYVASRRS